MSHELVVFFHICSVIIFSDIDLKNPAEVEQLMILKPEIIVSCIEIL